MNILFILEYKIRAFWAPKPCPHNSDADDINSTHPHITLYHHQIIPPPAHLNVMMLILREDMQRAEHLHEYQPPIANQYAEACISDYTERLQRSHICPF